MAGVGFLGVGVCCVFGLLGVVAVFVPVFSFARFVGAEAARAVASLVPWAVRCERDSLGARRVGALGYARLGVAWIAACGVGLIFARVSCCVGERLSDEESARLGSEVVEVGESGGYLCFEGELGGGAEAGDGGLIFEEVADGLLNSVGVVGVDGVGAEVVV